LKNILKLTFINCGFITEHLSIKYLGITKRYLKSLVKDNILICNRYLIFGKLTTVYSISDKYIDNIRNEGYYLYKHDTTQLEHDYILLKIFLSIPDDCKITWQNETALKYKFNKTTTTDAVYVEDKQIVGVEVLTPSYEKVAINNKMQFITKYCDKSIILNTKDF